MRILTLLLFAALASAGTNDLVEGNPSAAVKVTIFDDLQCGYCQTLRTMLDEKLLPRYGTQVAFIHRDLPLGRHDWARSAAMVARYLPPDRYEPFVLALFANQDRWAFARGVNTTDELWKTAALAGMARATFDQAIADDGLRTWILQQQANDQKQWNIDSTPSFVINGQKYAGEMSFDAFRKLIPQT